MRGTSQLHDRTSSVQLNGLTEDLIDILSKGPQVASQIAAIVRKIWPYLGTVRQIVDDPALPQIIERIKTIQALPSKPSATGVVPSPTVGVGLKHLIVPLDMYIYARRNPWAPWAVGAGIVLVLGGIGYRLGYRKAQRP